MVVSVRDSGVGIPQAMLPHIFEMFAQVDPSLEHRKEDKQRTLEAGFDHHLVKPVDPAALAALLASLERRIPPEDIQTEMR